MFLPCSAYRIPLSGDGPVPVDWTVRNCAALFLATAGRIEKKTKKAGLPWKTGLTDFWGRQIVDYFLAEVILLTISR